MRLQVDPCRGSVRAARHWVRDHAEASGLPLETIKVVELLTSELVANAVRHGGGQIIVDLQLSAVELAVSVTDEGEGAPIMRTTGPEVPGGHGVRLIERLSTRWGVESHRTGGKTVWFVLTTAR